VSQSGLTVPAYAGSLARTLGLTQNRRRPPMKLRLLELNRNSSGRHYFVGWDTTHANYKCGCSECDAELVFSFTIVHAGAWGWQKNFAQQEIETIASTFTLPTERAPNPWPSISRVNCSKCGTGFILYAAVDEYHHSAYRLAARGLARCEA